jgi:hypothetical protein
MRLLSEIGRNKKSAGPKGYQIISAGDMSQASVTSQVFSVEHTPIVGIQAVWNGSAPVGTLSLQGSIDGVNYFNIGSPVAVSGNNGTAYLTDPNAAYLYARLVYTRTSGSGDLDAFAEAKGF